MNYRDGQLFVDGIPIDLPLVDLAMEDLVGVTTPVTTPQLDWNVTGRATVDWFGAVPVAATEPTRPVRAQRAARPRQKCWTIFSVALPLRKLSRTHKKSKRLNILCGRAQSKTLWSSFFVGSREVEQCEKFSLSSCWYL